VGALTGFGGPLQTNTVVHIDDEVGEERQGRVTWIYAKPGIP